MEDACPECGRPLERADDFWYCDNPDCPRRAAARRVKTEPGSADSGAKATEPAAPPPGRRP